MFVVTWGDLKLATLRVQKKVEHIHLMREKKWTWGGHIMHTADNRWAEKVAEW